ncbi:acyl carrier protein [Streptomyces acidiscabies]|uniref:acyl carrier protein n=1 Tax=Streptomyces acidiscabies TaxID=42234 RepID=UPI00073F398B|nr:acyl carrier protein [Streptomyces acidiscabies]GAQ53345.1 acyl carrier protein [Streptomyces acidiscabies]
MTLDELKAVLAALGTDADLHEDTLREEVGLDSLGLAELAEVLREGHGLEVSDGELQETVTIGDLLALAGAAKAAR